LEKKLNNIEISSDRAIALNRFYHIGIACMVLSTIMACTSLYFFKTTIDNKQVIKRQLDSLSALVQAKPVNITFVGLIDSVYQPDYGTTLMGGPYSFKNSIMAVRVKGKPEIFAKGDSIMIYEYGSDKPRFALVLPYLKMYRIKE
jgi:hypothetical protein